MENKQVIKEARSLLADLSRLEGIANRHETDKEYLYRLSELEREDLNRLRNVLSQFTLYEGLI